MSRRDPARNDGPSPTIAGVTDGGEEAQPTRRRIPLPWLLTPIIISMAVGMFGDVIAPGLINERPLLAMFLNPRNRWLILASNQVEAIPFYLVGFLRLTLTDPIFYVLGLQYGDGVLKWIEEKSGESGQLVRAVERFFAKASYVVIVVAPNGYMCALAGATGMRPAVFATLNVTGTIARLILIRIFAEAFEEPIDDVLHWIGQYRWWLVGLSFLVVAIQTFRRKPIEPVDEAEQEILEAEREAHPSGGDGEVDP
jgi:membrane protein DedA with SNARE-associated domain